MMLPNHAPDGGTSTVWGIFDFRDNTWMMNEPGKRGWTCKPTQATPYASWNAAIADLAQLASSAHTPAIRPRALPHGDEPHR